MGIEYRGKCKKCNRQGIVSEDGICDRHGEDYSKQHLFWKHHIATDFLENPALIKGNGVGAGGNVYRDLDRLIEHSGEAFYWVAPVLLNDGEFSELGSGIFASLVTKTAIGDFCPIGIWKKVLDNRK